MRLSRITLQQFRNIPFASLALDGVRHFVLGRNGQGKTNLLEAVGYLTALRSFRTSDSRHMIAHGQDEAAMGFELEHGRRGPTHAAIRLRPDGREIMIDSEKVTRLSGFIGQFPTVVFCSQDQQLIRGNPAGRRRWLDLTLAAVDGGYLQALQRYHRALADRNALLRRNAGEPELAAFERPLAEHGAKLIAARISGLEQLAAGLQQAYSRIALSSRQDRMGFAYAPNAEDGVAGSLVEMFAKGRARDMRYRTTLTGPHRDDVEFTLNGHPARVVASEGQQRSLVLALRLAQAEWFRSHSGTPPLILADDVLGELDEERRAGFWAAVPDDWQVIATGTERPRAPGQAWQFLHVENGKFSAELPASV